MKYLDQFARYRWEGLFLFSLLFPFLCGFDKYLMHVAITISLNVAMATSMWLIWTLGLISFAHGGIMGIGAYTSALLLTKYGVPMWIGMWVGAVAAGLFALLISFPLMRTRAVYFFMASWAIGEVIKRNFAYFRDFTGGWNGVFNIKAPVLDLGFISLDFSDRTAFYYLAILVVSFVILFIYRINKSRTGMMFWSIHDHELLAQHIGINVLKQKVIAFTVACFLAGLAGALYAHYQTFINPKSFDIWKSEFALVHMIVGGLSTVGGPVTGAILLTVIDELLRAAGHFRVISFGVILIGVVILLPGGLESVPARIRNYFSKDLHK